MKYFIYFVFLSFMFLPAKVFSQNNTNSKYYYIVDTEGKKQDSHFSNVKSAEEMMRLKRIYGSIFSFENGKEKFEKKVKKKNPISFNINVNTFDSSSLQATSITFGYLANGTFQSCWCKSVEDADVFSKQYGYTTAYQNFYSNGTSEIYMVNSWSVLYYDAYGNVTNSVLFNSYSEAYNYTLQYGGVYAYNFVKVN